MKAVTVEEVVRAVAEKVKVQGRLVAPGRLAGVPGTGGGSA
jgi:hypothetical protein